MPLMEDGERSQFDGPAHVRAKFVELHGEEFAYSYLSGATWRYDNMTLTPRTMIAYERIRDQAMGIVRELGIQLAEPTKKAAVVAYESMSLFDKARIQKMLADEHETAAIQMLVKETGTRDITQMPPAGKDLMEKARLRRLKARELMGLRS